LNFRRWSYVLNYLFLGDPPPAGGWTRIEMELSTPEQGKEEIDERSPTDEEGHDQGKPGGDESLHSRMRQYRELPWPALERNSCAT